MEITAYPAVISILVVISIITLTVLCSDLIYRKIMRSRKLNRESENQSLFSDFHLVIYDAFFGQKAPEDVAEKFGINAEKYYHDCQTAGCKADLKKLIAKYIYGIILIVSGIISGILINIIPAILFSGNGICIMLTEKSRISSRAEKKQNEIEQNIPDFLDLLKTELEVGVPVEIAVHNICEKKDDLLSREFFRTMKEMQLGASDWCSALEAMADRYNVDSLTEFVLETTTAYRNGTSIAGAVRRKSESIRKSYLLSVKEKAGKATNTVLLPMTLCQIIPMIIFLMIPTMLQAMGGLL